MPPLDLWSEPVPATGSVTAQGVRNALGRPHIGQATLLAREAIQNSFDAAAGPTISFAVDAIHVEAGGRSTLRDELFARVPDAGLKLRPILEEASLPMLIVSDRGTSGLGGPTRAGMKGDAPTDFADFIRNVGQPPDKEYGGGTYGYGKAVFFLASRASAIVAYTRVLNRNTYETRLMGIGLGEPYRAVDNGKDRAYTGRHWWGRLAQDGVVEPVLNDEADTLATRIGMPLFRDDERGTSIMVIGADFGNATLEDSAHEIAEAIAWYCWPHMLGQIPRLDASVTVDGRPLAIPDPERDPVLRMYADAYRASLGKQTRYAVRESSEEIKCEKPRKQLGQLGLVTVPLTAPAIADEGDDPKTAGPNCVALMRSPRLVVTYVAGNELPMNGVAWAGAFKVYDDVDRAFAQAEPPSHDSWTVNALPRSAEKTYVTVALKRIREAVRTYTTPSQAPSVVGEPMSLAQVASTLGGILWAEGGPSAREVAAPGPNGGANGRMGSGGGSTEGGGNGPHSPRHPATTHVQILGTSLAREAGGVVSRVRFKLEKAAGSGRVKLWATGRVLVNDGSTLEREPPVGAATPRVLRWVVEGKAKTSTSCDFPAGEVSQEGFVDVTMPDDASITIELGTSEVTADPGA